MSAGAVAGTTGAAGSAGYAAAMANAIKACGTVVRVDPEVFTEMLARQDSPLVVRTVGGIFSTSYRYLTSYRGLAFHCKSPTELRLPQGTELIHVKKMSMPDI